ncbi:outer membrane protein transport protein [Sutterella wadsworthensis]|uniref:outer membrane protein transport protein n=1 Tax=Sutterella wadsworthensis TaxID=40545 RepID=UPI000E05939F|nr:outer membrane protein transport protein (OMPP1/FadL/TodX) [Sutterella wadsworthensis]
MNHTSFKIAAAALAVASALSSTAYAGGFQLTEQSALALGRAYAGVGVDGTDVSGMYYNAATMTLHPGTQVQFGGVGVGMNLEYVDHQYSGEKKITAAIRKSLFRTALFRTRSMIQPGLVLPSRCLTVLQRITAKIGTAKITATKLK